MIYRRYIGPKGYLAIKSDKNGRVAGIWRRQIVLRWKNSWNLENWPEPELPTPEASVDTGRSALGLTCDVLEDWSLDNEQKREKGEGKEKDN